jgi:NDP-sugar pyrophosphorylase family protein
VDHVSALVLAAGHSSRIAPVTNGTPKPLISIQGTPIIGYNLKWLARHGVRRVWVNLHHRGDMIRAALGDGTPWGVEITYSEEPEILGTAGAARKLLDELSDPFVVVYGDNLVEFNLTDLLETHRRRKADVTIALFDDSVPNTGIAGGRVRLGPDGSVAEFLEGATARPDVAPYVNAGVYAARPDVLRPWAGGQFFDWGKDVFPHLLTSGACVQGYPITGYCLGLDTPVSYERGLALIASGQVTLS